MCLLTIYWPVSVGSLSKKSVMFGNLYTHPLLERISSQLSVRTSDLEPTGDRSIGTCPNHYNYDVVLPLIHASIIEPWGWVLFTAKYMDLPWGIDQLLKRVVTVLPKHVQGVALASLVVRTYCTGPTMSGRLVRRKYDMGRSEYRAYHLARERVLANFHAVEAEYARIVKKYL